MRSTSSKDGHSGTPAVALAGQEVMEAPHLHSVSTSCRSAVAIDDFARAPSAAELLAVDDLVGHRLPSPVLTNM